MDSHTKLEAVVVGGAEQTVDQHPATLFYQRQELCYPLDGSVRPKATNGLFEKERKLSCFYHRAWHGLTLDKVYGQMGAGGGHFFFDFWDVALHAFNRWNDSERIKTMFSLCLFRYDVPAHEQEKFFELCQKTSMRLDDLPVFCASPTLDMPVCNIIKFEYCSGYWAFHLNFEKQAIEARFTQYHEADKRGFLQQLKQQENQCRPSETK